MFVVHGLTLLNTSSNTTESSGGTTGTTATTGTGGTENTLTIGFSATDLLIITIAVGSTTAVFNVLRKRRK